MGKGDFGVFGLKAVGKKAESVFTAYLRCEGRVTVPKCVRDAYGIEEGDLVECRIRKLR
jgi:bifunctional DNA-binding transcriptional regulator/antitoxin component of YhaV-PrlF toxin-antitoxin module